MKILIVEDEAVIALQLQTILERIGHRVVGTAPTAEAAVELARTGKPQLAFVDVRLNDGSSGVEAAKRMKQDLGVPCLMVTSYCGEARDAQEAAIGCLQKPFSERDISAALFVAEDLMHGQRPAQLPQNLELYPASGIGWAH
jgi:CheY-like chemotaxis protein